VARLFADQPEQQHAQIAGTEEAAAAAATEAFPASSAYAFKKAVAVPATAPVAVVLFAKPEIVGFAGKSVPVSMTAETLAIIAVFALVSPVAMWCVVIACSHLI
jgi:hypothetical protein